jgi:hypothetical protein
VLLMMQILLAFVTSGRRPLGKIGVWNHASFLGPSLFPCRFFAADGALEVKTAGI